MIKNRRRMNRTVGHTTTIPTTNTKAIPHHLCDHHGKEVHVGPYTIKAGGTRYLQPKDFNGVDLLVPLTNVAGPLQFGKRYEVLAGTLADFGGVDLYWREFLEIVIEELKQGKTILAFCVASHGRTGTFLASLIALLESETQTPDPIAAVRERHCIESVETFAQAEAIFELRGRPLPERYVREFGKVAHAVDPSKQPQP